MNANDFEYYRVHRKNDKTIPLLDPDSGCPRYLSKKVPIEDPELMVFKLGQPVPKAPKMADYHSSPNSVISKKIYDVLSPLKIEGLQLLPSTIRVNDDEVYSNYWAMHIYQRIQCINAAKSDCVIDDISLGYVKKLVLDHDALKAIPLKNRLIFRLQEDRSYELFHASVVDAIMKVNPEGIRFTNINEWSEKSLFQ